MPPLSVQDWNGQQVGMAPDATLGIQWHRWMYLSKGRWDLTVPDEVLVGVASERTHPGPSKWPVPSQAAPAVWLEGRFWPLSSNMFPQ